VYICAGVLSSSPYSHRALSPLSSRLGVLAGVEKAPVPLCPLPRREVAAPARACRGGHPKPKVRAPTPSGLRPRGHASSDLFLSLALYCSFLELLSSIHAISFLLLPRTRENRWIFVSRLNQFGKQVLQVVLPRARSEKHATLWLLFSTVPSSEFWCFLPSKKSPALSFCPV
jgi:hypothetical protein